MRDHPRLMRRGSTFYFRMSVPAHLRNKIGKHEIKFSLQTVDRKTAILRSRSISNQIDILFSDELTMTHSTLEQIEKRVRDIFQDEINWANEVRHTFRGNVDLEIEAQGCDEMAARALGNLKAQKYDPSLLAEANTLLEGMKLDSTMSKADAIDLTADLLLRARVESNRVIAAHLRGSFEKTEPTDPLFSGMSVNGFPALPGNAPCAINCSTDKNNLTLKQAHEKFSDHQLAAGIEQKTIWDLNRAMEFAYAVLETEMSVSDLTNEDIRAVRDLISSVPVHQDKKPKLRDLSLVEAAKVGPEYPRMHVTTQRKRLAAVKGLLNWLNNEGYIDAVPGEKIQITSKKKGMPSRGPYSQQQLKTIFSSPIYAGRKSLASLSEPGPILHWDHYYWVPLIALYTGMRVNEILQLEPKDYRREDSIPYFDVNDVSAISPTGIKKLKTESSFRRIPIHWKLIELGFLKFIGLQKEDRIFSGVKKGSDGTYSQNFSKAWSRYAQKVGFYTPTTVFHSFRHNFKDACEEAGVASQIVHQLMGHKVGSVHEGYGKGVSLQKLKAEIDKVEYPIAIKPKTH